MVLESTISLQYWLANLPAVSQASWLVAVGGPRLNLVTAHFLGFIHPFVAAVDEGLDTHVLFKGCQANTDGDVTDNFAITRYDNLGDLLAQIFSQYSGIVVRRFRQDTKEFLPTLETDKNTLDGLELEVWGTLNN